MSPNRKKVIKALINTEVLKAPITGSLLSYSFKACKTTHGVNKVFTVGCWRKKTKKKQEKEPDNKKTIKILLSKKVNFPVYFY